MSEWVRLGDAATFVNGYAFKPDDWEEKGLEIIRIQNLTESSSEIHYFDGTIPEKYIVYPGDVLISWSGSLGVYVWKKEKAILNQHIFKVVFDKLKFDKNYFVYLISQKISEMSRQTHGSTMKHITKKDFDKIEIPYISIKEQESISKILDTVNSLIDARKKQIALLDEAEKSLFVEMFGDSNKIETWTQQLLGEIADITVGVVIKPAQYYTNSKDGVKAFRSLNIAESKIIDDDWVYFSADGQNKNKKSIVQEGDVLVVRSGKPGTACIVTKEYVGYNAIDLIIARPNPEYLDSQYLCRFTNSDDCKRKIESKTNGVAQQHYNVGAYKKLLIPLPPLSLQKEFAARISSIEERRREMERGLQQMEEARSALMQEYFG